MLEKEFLEYGFSFNEYQEIISSYTFNNVREDIILRHFKENNLFFEQYGYTRENIIKMTLSLPQIYSLSVENIKQKIDDLIQLGYTRENIIKMTKIFPSIYSRSIENIKQKINDLIQLGYTREDVIKMTLSLPSIYGLSIENIKQKINDLIQLGYTREDVIKMTLSLPTIYGLSIENLSQKINDLIQLGYTRENVIKMTLSLPTIYGLSIENLRQKTEFFNAIGLHDIFINNSKYLMQSITLSYARYKFYLEKGINIDTNNYRRLFTDQKKFEKSYGITKKELISRYNYDKYLEELQNARVI